MKRLTIVGLIFLVTLSGAVGWFVKTGAAFNPNRLIDDGIMNNVNAMSATQIDAFLNSHPYSCISPNSGFEARIPTGYSPSGGFTYGSFGTAGQVIAAAAQAYDLNPQVLIVLLEKEQSLVTGRNSSTYCYGTDHKYAAATGYGCPDSGGSYSWSGISLYRRNGVERTSIASTCVNSASKAGFSQQLIRSAWQLKFSQQRSLGNIGWAIIRGSWDNSDDLNSCYAGPMTEGVRKACPHGAATYYDGYRTIDGQAIKMETGGTAALYWYTPHLHGNQLFVNLFTNWFGSPVIPNYSWVVTNQYVYSDQTKTAGRTLYNILPGTRLYVGFRVKNTSNYVWSNTGNHPITVGTVRPIDRNSPFCDSTWLGCNRPARMIEQTVNPGEYATFEFWMKAPSQPGTYREYFSLVAEGQAWFPDIGLIFESVVSPPRFTWQIVSQYAYSDETKTQGKSTVGLLPGDRVYVGVKVRNTGNMTWNKSGKDVVKIAPIRPIDKQSPFYDPTWLSPTRAATLVENSVPPGGIGTFEFWMKAPSTPGVYPAYFGLVVEAVTWMDDIGLNFYTTVSPPRYSWQLISQYAYTDETKTAGKNMLTLKPGERAYVGFKVKNTGNVTWTKTGPNPVYAGTIRPIDRPSPFIDIGWIGQNRPAALVENSVPPGGIGTFEFWMKAPSTPGEYREYIGLVAEGITWMDDLGLNFYSRVQ
ncbi:hypothetical protein IRY61_03555 [Candidatus Saccharibacteria bacterium]|nr:hypothetical protein [Candidatus Saccharibacteria bacterium]